MLWVLMMTCGYDSCDLDRIEIIDVLFSCVLRNRLYFRCGVFDAHVGK